jgi:hypothetical protein
MADFPRWREYLRRFIENEPDEKFRDLLNQELQLVDDILAVHLWKPQIRDDQLAHNNQVEEAE